MKILILSRGIPSEKDPQEGCFEWDQAKALKAAGHEVVVMAIDGRIRKYWRKIGIKRTFKDGIIAYKLFYFPTSIIRRLISLKLGYRIEAYFARKLYNLILKQQGSFDIVHSHYLTSSFYGASIKQKYGVKLVATEHWSEVRKTNLSEEVEFLGNSTYPYVDKLISVSKDLGYAINEKFGKPSAIIHNLIDISYLKPALTHTDNSFYTIVAVGTLLNLKGFDILIKAFYSSKLRNLPIKVKIIGKGPEYQTLNKLIISLGLDGKVVLCGQMKKTDIFNELHTADLYVLSSRRENFSVAIIEATANGLPTIATLCGGTDEYPVSECTKIPVDDVQALKEALEYKYDTRESVDRKKIQEETLHYFSPSAIVSQLEDVYNSVLLQNK